MTKKQLLHFLSHQIKSAEALKPRTDSRSKMLYKAAQDAQTATLNLLSHIGVSSEEAHDEVKKLHETHI